MNITDGDLVRKGETESADVHVLKIQKAVFLLNNCIIAV